MAWHDGSDCAGAWWAGVESLGGAAKWQSDGSLAAGDAAWTWAAEPSIQHGMAWHADRPAGSAVSQGDLVVGVGSDGERGPGRPPLA